MSSRLISVLATIAVRKTSGCRHIILKSITSTKQLTFAWSIFSMDCTISLQEIHPLSVHHLTFPANTPVCMPQTFITIVVIFFIYMINYRIQFHFLNTLAQRRRANKPLFNNNNNKLRYIKTIRRTRY